MVCALQLRKQWVGEVFGVFEVFDEEGASFALLDEFRVEVLHILLNFKLLVVVDEECACECAQHLEGLLLHLRVEAAQGFHHLEDEDR